MAHFKAERCGNCKKLSKMVCNKNNEQEIQKRKALLSTSTATKKKKSVHKVERKSSKNRVYDNIYEREFITISPVRTDCSVFLQREICI